MAVMPKEATKDSQAVINYARKHNIPITEATKAFNAFQTNPNSPEFNNLPETQKADIRLAADAASKTKPIEAGTSKSGKTIPKPEAVQGEIIGSPSPGMVTVRTPAGVLLNVPGTKEQIDNVKRAIQAGEEGGKPPFEQYVPTKEAVEEKPPVSKVKTPRDVLVGEEEALLAGRQTKLSKAQSLQLEEEQLAMAQAGLLTPPEPESVKVIDGEKFRILPDGSKITESALESLKQSDLRLYTLLTTQGFERYKGELESTHTRLPDGQYISNDVLQKLKQESPALHRIMIKGGYGDYTEYVSRNYKVLADGGMMAVEDLEKVKRADKKAHTILVTGGFKEYKNYLAEPPETKWHYKDTIITNKQRDELIKEFEAKRKAGELSLGDVHPADLTTLTAESLPAETRRRLQKVRPLLSFVPVVGTALYWQDMSPGWRVASIVGDAFFFASPWLIPRMAKWIKGGVRFARGTKKADEATDIVRSVLQREAIEARRFGVFVPQVADKLDEIAKISSEYADDLIELKRLQKLKAQGWTKAPFIAEVPSKADAISDVEQVLRLEKLLDNASDAVNSSKRLLKATLDDYVDFASRIVTKEGTKGISKTKGTISLMKVNPDGSISWHDVPGVVKRTTEGLAGTTETAIKHLKHASRGVISQIDDLVDDVASGGKNVAITRIADDLAKAETALSQAKAKFPMKADAWADLVSEVNHLQTKLKIAQAGSIQDMHLTLVKARQSIPKLQRLLQQAEQTGDLNAIRFYSSQLDEVSRLANTLPKALDDALKALEYEYPVKTILTGGRPPYRVGDLGSLTGTGTATTPTTATMTAAQLAAIKGTQSLITFARAIKFLTFESEPVVQQKPSVKTVVRPGDFPSIKAGESPISRPGDIPGLKVGVSSVERESEGQAPSIAPAQEQQTLAETETEAEIKTATQMETQPATATETKLGTAVDVIPKPVVKVQVGTPAAILPGAGKTDKEKRKIIKDSNGALAWRQGELNGKDVWHVLMHPYKSEDDYLSVIGKKPANATVVRGPRSAYQTVKLLYGDAPDRKVTGDIGFMDFALEPKGKKKIGIGFTPDPKMETTGDITIGQSRMSPITERPPRLQRRGRPLSGRGLLRITPKRPRLGR